jgi:phage protein D
VTTVTSPALVILPSVSIGPGEGAALSPGASRCLVRVTVETHLHLPSMFELAFVGATGSTLQAAGVVMGAQVRISASASAPELAKQLITGEVTAFEGLYEDLTGTTTVRGYDLSHRLQRARRTRAFVNVSDADAAERIARDAGLELGEITPSEVIHSHLPQYDQTDWEFLKQRAAETGYEFSMADGLFSFRRASSLQGPGAATAYQLKLHSNLRSFSARVTAGNLTPDVEVRVWDPLAAKVVSAVSGARTGSASATGEQSPETLAGVFSDPADGADPGPPPSPVVEELGPPPSGTAFVVYDRPVGTGPSADSAATLLADGLTEQTSSTFAEAEGEAAGTPAIQAGARVTVEGVPGDFPAGWVVTRARHLFAVAEHGYTTEFAATGRHDRSLLGLASVGATQAPLPRIPGVVCGVVTNVNDSKARVKVTLPWLSPDYESDWAPVALFGAGPRSGAMFLPEVGDQVLLGFEFGDPRRPYVLGGIVSAASHYSLGGAAVQATGEAASVVRRGFVAPSGNMIAFYDEMPPGDDPEPTASRISLGTRDGSFGLALDVVKGTLTLACAPQQSPGRLTINCANAGSVTIQAGAGGTMTIDGGDSLTVKAQTSLTIQSNGDLALKGATISLN